MAQVLARRRSAAWRFKQKKPRCGDAKTAPTVLSERFFEIMGDQKREFNMFVVCIYTAMPVITPAATASMNPQSAPLPAA